MIAKIRLVLLGCESCAIPPCKTGLMGRRRTTHRNKTAPVFLSESWENQRLRSSLANHTSAHLAAPVTSDASRLALPLPTSSSLPPSQSAPFPSRLPLCFSLFPGERPGREGHDRGHRGGEEGRENGGQQVLGSVQARRGIE